MDIVLLASANTPENGYMVLYGAVAFITIVLVVCWVLKYGAWFKKK